MNVRLPPKPTKLVQTRVDARVLKKLRLLAARQEMSVAAYMRRVLREHVETHEV